MREAIDIESEQALLGGLMLEANNFDSVSDYFSPQLFGHEPHRHIAIALLSLRLQNAPFEAPLICAHLDSAGVTEYECPRDMVYALEKAFGTPGNIRHYAEHLADLSADRSLFRAAREIIADTGGTSAERLERAAAKISAIERRAPSASATIGEATLEWLEQLDQERKDNAAGKSTLISTGFAALDSYIGGLCPGVLHVIAARPGAGKSAFAVALADNLASQGHGVGIFWLEDERTHLAKRAMIRRAKISSTVVRHGSRLSVEQWDKLGIYANVMASLPIWVDDSKGLTCEEVTRRIRSWKRTNPSMRVVMLDHLGEIRHSHKEGWGDRHDLEIGRAVKLFRDVSIDLGLVPILFSQMNRAIEKREGPPRMSDLDNSGQIEQAARFIGFINRPENTNQFEIQIKKNTNGPNDCIVRLDWLEDYMTVEEPRARERVAAARAFFAMANEEQE